ncbi:hypothetical protein [Streptomyces platensis]|uniref:hypothetical protein n=1 Tax=Streptomyces platensis TaxID=58346 RepID=UPI0036CDFE81
MRQFAGLAAERHLPGAGRWDGSGDYRSLGCIKLKPADIDHLFTKAGQAGWPTKLKVVG